MRPLMAEWKGVVSCTWMCTHEFTERTCGTIQGRDSSTAVCRVSFGINEVKPVPGMSCVVLVLLV